MNCSKERNLIGNNREKRIEMIINFFRTNQILTGYWYNITTWHELEKAADFIHEDPADVLEAYELLQEEIWDDEVME